MRVRIARQPLPFVQVPRDVLRDKTISIEARGTLALLMTYADSWDFNTSHLRDLVAVGRDKIRAILRELEDRGFLIREGLRDPDTGRMVGSRWMIIDDPAAFSGGAGPAFSDDSGPVSGGGISVIGADESEGAEEANSGPENVDLPGNLREPENPVLGDNPSGGLLESRGAGLPGVGTYGPLRRESLKNNKKKIPLTPSRERVSRRSKRAGEDVVEAPVATQDDLARFWAERVIAGKAAGSSAIKPDLARRMVALGLVQPQQLRAVGVSF